MFIVDIVFSFIDMLEIQDDAQRNVLPCKKRSGFISTCFVLQSLTGGVLLLRNKYYIVIYRGKDFLPTSVASTLSERQELTKEIQDVEEKVRSRGLEAAQSSSDKVQAPAGTLAEFYEAQARWGRDISHEEREKMVEEASRAQHARLVKRIEHKLAVVSIFLLSLDIFRGT